MEEHPAVLSPSSSSANNVILPLTLGGMLMVVNVAQTAFAQYAANPDGSFPFHESSAVLLAEFGKLILALLLLARAYFCQSVSSPLSNDPRFQLTSRIVLEMAVPGLLYTVSNILSYTTVGLLGSTNYQLFSNMKIIITALTFRSMIQKRLKVIQWVCLVFLTAGLLVASTGHNPCNSSEKDHEANSTARLSSGFAMMVVLSLTSSFAGVYSELKLKKAPQHPMLQNALMYAWSCLICLVQYFYKTRVYSQLVSGLYDGNDSGGGGGTFFQGFSFALWGSVFTNALYGQVVALVLYYCDNIVKVFANSVTVFGSALFDHFLFHKRMTSQVGIAGSIVVFSIIIYYGDHSLLLKEDSDFFASAGSATITKTTTTRSSNSGSMQQRVHALSDCGDQHCSISDVGRRKKRHSRRKADKTDSTGDDANECFI
mmetsp:Transcript_5255/g.11421  ORF Transcript_5255/g.11421 Transcript_5255/m.11421 type:complete len:428 (-) Transcript_5255:249-1532(-)